MEEDKYTGYTLEDFLNDDSFVRWAAGREQDPADSRFWSAFVSTYPAAAGNFDMAVRIIRAYRAQDVSSGSRNKAALWERITDTIQQAPQAGTKARWLRPWMKAAAAVLIVALTGYLAVQQLTQRKQLIATGYGEKRTLTLPDNSVVILNANSSLHYSRQWDSAAPREVWIKGEAFFDVAHINRDTGRIAPHERFLVHTNGVTIEVLGTSFNVKSRRGKTNIGLVTGKIKVDCACNNAKGKAIVMLPGDYIEYGSDSLLINQKLDKPEKIKDWTKPEIIFTDASLEEIIETLQDNYGYTVDVNNENIRRLKIAGEINVATVDELLAVISTTLDIRVDKSSDKHLLFYLDR